jgi:outer membrane protein OmpA-like peptidoglycan-associated protein
MTGRVLLVALGAGLVAVACGRAEAPPPSENVPARSAEPPPPAEAASTPRRLDEGRALTGRVSGLSGAASALGARVTETEIVVDLPSDVLFEFDEAELQPGAEPTLRQLATLVREHPVALVSINGHTDAIGSREYNQALSERRAEAVAGWLAGPGGIERERLRPAGFGATRPTAPNQRPDGSDDPEGRRQNRRVEVVLPRG